MLLAAARAEVALGTCDQALRLTLQIIKSDPSHTEAYATRGLALFLSGDFDQAAKHLKESYASLLARTYNVGTLCETQSCMVL